MIGHSQLGVVELAETPFVGRLVDAAVVGVDEPLAGDELALHLDGDRRRRPVADRTGTAQVRFGERRSLQLGG